MDFCPLPHHGCSFPSPIHGCCRHWGWYCYEQRPDVLPEAWCFKAKMWVLQIVPHQRSPALNANAAASSGHGVAANGHRLYNKQDINVSMRPPLLQVGHQPCYMRPLALLHAVADLATSGCRPCYFRPPTFLLMTVGLATCSPPTVATNDQDGVFFDDGSGPAVLQTRCFQVAGRYCDGREKGGGAATAWG
jgi:hypothetical protein